MIDNVNSSTDKGRRIVIWKIRKNYADQMIIYKLDWLHFEFRLFNGLDDETFSYIVSINSFGFVT